MDYKINVLYFVTRLKTKTSNSMVLLPTMLKFYEISLTNIYLTDG